MIKTLIISCLLFLVSCNKLNNDKETSTTSIKVENSKNEDYKSLEGTPFNFNNLVCSRKLFGSDIIKVLSDYKFSPSNGKQYPNISRLNEGGYLEVNAQSGINTYFGNMKVSANGEFVYFNAYTQNWITKEYDKTQVEIKLTPIQIPNRPFQMEIEIKQYGKVVINEKLTIVNNQSVASSYSDRNDNSNNCFENDEDVLEYLIGKTFTHQEGAYVAFTSKGGSYSGIRDLKWLSYESVEGKGLVKLESLSNDCPQCIYTFWISCDGYTITTPPEDGYLKYVNN